MKLNRRQKIGFAVVILGNLILWIIPGDVVEQIARDRHTMLGRYSRTHFIWIVGVTMISIVSLYIDSATGEKYKKRWFQVIATLLFLVPTLAVVDYLLRSPEKNHYVKDSIVYHRPALSTFQLSFEDRPKAYRTYPDAPKGYGRVDCTLHTDRRGFRNQTDLEQYDVVALGDSFTEGSRVSNEHPWPVRLAQYSGLSVYNLGMSGYDPLQYRESLKEIGLSLKPRFVLCMLYEGNDFRSARSDRRRMKPGFSKRLKSYFKQSPLLTAMDEMLIHTFGPINSAGTFRGVEILDWLPLSIPEGPKAHPYTFAPKQLRDLYLSEEGFSVDRHWLNPRKQLEEMNELCTASGARFIVVFAPTKAHVTMPMMADRLPAEKVRSFMKLRYKYELPEPDSFLTQLLANAGAKENVIHQWCRKNTVPFISLTSALRASTRAGLQTYYTYDQHWTPEGHDVTARAVHRFLQEHHLFDMSDVTSR